MEDRGNGYLSAVMARSMNYIYVTMHDVMHDLVHAVSGKFSARLEDYNALRISERRSAFFLFSYVVILMVTPNLKSSIKPTFCELSCRPLQYWASQAAYGNGQVLTIDEIKSQGVHSHSPPEFCRSNCYLSSKIPAIPKGAIHQ